MDEHTDLKKMPGVDAAMKSYSTASKSMQDFAVEMQRMTKTSMDQTTQLMDKMRGAKTIEDVVAIQASYMQQSVANFTDCTRRFGELMMSMPMEIAKQSQSAFHQGIDTATKATEQAGEQIRDAGEHFNQHSG